jgi:hypothetical protein
MMYTKCAKCRKWDECARCGACHTCRPDVRAACILAREADAAQSLLRTPVARKHQASTFSQDPGIGANGCEPRVTARHRTWYGSPEYREATQFADKAPEREQRYVWRVSGDGTIVRITDSPRLSGKARNRALYGF